MKLIIAGGRDIHEELAYGEIVRLRSENHPLTAATEIVSGGCRGADKAGEMYADFYDLNVKTFYAEWDRYGPAAGPIRNGSMADYADALLLIWNGTSRGSANMKQQMLAKNKPIYEIIIT